MKVVLNRALSIASRGLLAGSAIALATHGLIQVPQPVDIPVEIIPPAIVGTGGGTNIPGDFYLAIPQSYHYAADIRLLLRSDTIARLLKHQPIEIVETESTGLRAFYDAHGELQIISESEWKHWDQAADEEETLILVAAYRLLKEDEVYVWPNEKYS